MKLMAFGLHHYEKESIFQSVNAKYLSKCGPSTYDLREIYSDGLEEILPSGYKQILFISCSTDTRDWMHNKARVEFNLHHRASTGLVYKDEELFLDVYWLVAKPLDTAGETGDIFLLPNGNLVAIGGSDMSFDWGTKIHIEGPRISVPKPFGYDDYQRFYARRDYLWEARYVDSKTGKISEIKKDYNGWLSDGLDATTLEGDANRAEHLNYYSQINWEGLPQSSYRAIHTHIEALLGNWDKSRSKNPPRVFKFRYQRFERMTAYYYLTLEDGGVAPIGWHDDGAMSATLLKALGQDKDWGIFDICELTILPGGTYEHHMRKAKKNLANKKQGDQSLKK